VGSDSQVLVASVPRILNEPLFLVQLIVQPELWRRSGSGWQGSWVARSPS